MTRREIEDRMSFFTEELIDCAMNGTSDEPVLENIREFLDSLNDDELEIALGYAGTELEKSEKEVKEIDEKIYKTLN